LAGGGRYTRNEKEKIFLFLGKSTFKIRCKKIYKGEEKNEKEF